MHYQLLFLSSSFQSECTLFDMLTLRTHTGLKMGGYPSKKKSQQILALHWPVVKPWSMHVYLYTSGIMP